MSEFFIKYTDTNTVIPRKELHSAAFLIALDGEKILAIKNDRGWEIPGGQIDKGETQEEALIREVKEAAGGSFSDAKLLAIIESSNQGIYKDKVMFVYATKHFKLGEFTPSEDAFEREIIDINEFLQRHKGTINFTELISRAKDLINM